MTDHSGDTTDGGGVPAQLRSVATTALELAEPVAQAVQTTVARATRAVDEWRHLADRVERLESEVAELREQLEARDG